MLPWKQAPESRHVVHIAKKLHVRALAIHSLKPFGWLSGAVNDEIRFRYRPPSFRWPDRGPGSAN
jgi:hypothetical protein